MNGKDSAGSTSLLVLMQYDSSNSRVFRALLQQQKLDVNAVAEGGETALIIATRHYCSRYVKGCFRSETLVTIRALLKHPELNVNAKDDKGLTAFSHVSLARHSEVLCEFLKHDDVDVNERFKNGETALIRACLATYISIDMVRELLKHNKLDGNAKDDEGYTAFMRACLNTGLGVVLNWWEHDDVNVAHDSLERDNLDVICKLLNHDGVDVNAKTDCGDTALLLTIHRYSRSTEVFFFGLTEQGGVTERYTDGRHQRKLDIVLLLLAHKKIDVNAADDQGRTPFYWASHYGCCEIVREMLKNEKVDVNVRDASGNTPLISACLNGRLGVVRMLLEHEKVDVHVMKTSGLTALDIARNHGMPEITQCLEEYFNVCCKETSGNSKRKRKFS